MGFYLGPMLDEVRLFGSGTKNAVKDPKTKTRARRPSHLRALPGFLLSNSIDSIPESSTSARLISHSSKERTPFPLLHLPPEIRDEIYQYAFAPDHDRNPDLPLLYKEPESYLRVYLDISQSLEMEAIVTWQPRRSPRRYINPISLFLANKQISAEAARVFYSSIRVELVHPDLRPDATTLTRSLALACPSLQRHTRHLSIQGSPYAMENEVMVGVLSSFQSLQRLEVRYDLSRYLYSQIAVEIQSFLPLQEKEIELEFKSVRSGANLPADETEDDDGMEPTWLEKGREGVLGIWQWAFIAFMVLSFMCYEAFGDVVEHVFSVWDL